MEINRQNIMQIIRDYNLRADKDFGQNFLIDSNVSKRIVEALEIKDDEQILEIGPGLGSLTHFLLEKSENVTVVDIDPSMIFFLNCIYSKTSLNIVENDMRKEDVSKYNKIIANLPYNITTEAVNYLLLNADNASKMVLMCQLEAFNRFHDLKGKDYGPTSILIHLLGESKKILVASKGLFYPAPKIDSIVFTIDLNKNIDRNLAKQVYKFTKVLFLNRRKTIYNNLGNYLKNKDVAKNVLDDLNIPLNKRPEEISYDLFLKIYKQIKNY